MKLFARYNRLNIFATIVIFIVGSCAFYVLLQFILIRQLDSALRSEQQEVMEYVRLHNALPEIINTKDQHDVFESGSPVTEAFETVGFKEGRHEEKYRNIRFNVVVAGSNYRILVSKPLKGTELLLSSIILVTLVMIALILLVGLLINRRILNNIWRPFYNTVDQVKNYNLSAPGTVVLLPTAVDEFALLNQSISAMMERVQHDYEALKKFTGHAAHEMQTPLAVIRTRMDILMQQEMFLHQYGPGIMEIENAVQRLSRLNRSLLLLTKVENRQFVMEDDVRIDEIVATKCTELSEMMQVKNITLSLALTPFSVRFHNHLAEIMVNNLINNAIRYNVANGIIDVKLEEGRLTVANTSALTALEQERVFERFYRHSDVKIEGNGLGLSIVKQICDLAGFTVSYSYSNDMHIFCVDLNNRTIG